MLWRKAPKTEARTEIKGKAAEWKMSLFKASVFIPGFCQSLRSMLTSWLCLSGSEGRCPPPCHNVKARSIRRMKEFQRFNTVRKHQQGGLFFGRRGLIRAPSRKALSWTGSMLFFSLFSLCLRPIWQILGTPEKLPDIQIRALRDTSYKVQPVSPLLMSGGLVQHKYL